MAESSEYTPLLSDPSAGDLGENQQTITAISSNLDSQQCTPYLRTTVVMTWISVVCSAVALCFSVTIVVMNEHTPPHYYMGWPLRECSIAMVMLSAITAIVSSINLISLYRRRAAMWLLVNLVLDGFITYYAAGIGGFGLSETFDGYNNSCSPYGNDPMPPNEKAVCEAFATKIKILAAIAMGLGVALAINHLVFFIIRCVIAYRWAMRNVSNGTLRLPAGQLSVEFKIKFMRQENAVEERIPEGNVRVPESHQPRSAPEGQSA